MTEQMKKRLRLCLLLTTLLIVTAAILYILKMNGVIQLRCPIRMYTGLECPACGLTRMVTSILNLEVYQAFRYNPFIFTAIPWIVYMYIAIWRCYIKYGVVSDRLANQLLVFAFILITFGVIRNLSWFTFLKPTTI